MNKTQAGSIPVPATTQRTKNQPVAKVAKKNGHKNGHKKVSKRKLFEDFKIYSSSMITYLPYKPACLYSAGNDTSKEWYVYYFYKINGSDKYKRFKERFDINRIADVKDRLHYGKVMVRYINQCLETGFNPFKSVATTQRTFQTISDQLQVIIKEQTRSASKYKIECYNEHFNRFSKFINDDENPFFDSEHLKELSMHEFDEQHADAYRDYVDQVLNLSVKTINASLSYMATFFKYAKRKKWCDKNPFGEVERMNKNQKQNKDERYEPLTSPEIDAILKHLNATGNRDYLRFLAMIFYGWARPAEIARLKVADIDLNRNVIRFPKGETKNKQGAFVQIVPPLKKLLQEIKMQNYNQTLYLFSGDGTGFAPGTTQLTRNRSSQRWNDIVKKELKIKKDQYALKHTGNIEYLLLNKGNVDLKWQQMQNRHSSSAMTDRYNRKLGAYFIDVG
jgi:integrase